MRWRAGVVTVGLVTLALVQPTIGRHAERPSEAALHVVDNEPRPWQAFYQDSAEALARGDVDAAVAAAERAARVGPPNHPLVLYAQLRAFSRAGRFDQAFSALGLLVEKGIASDVLVSPAFEALRDQPRWDEFQPRLQELVAPASRSVVAFRLNEPDFIPEAMTYDRGSRRFLIGSLHKRKVIAVDEVTGRTADYATFREAGFLSVLGLEADNTRGALYVLSAGGREMQGYTADVDGQSFLHRLQLSSGRQVTRLAPPVVEGGHLLNDLVQAADGTLYMTDSKAGVVYRWKAGTKALDAVATIGRYLYPNGLTPSADWRSLYVAHMEGLSRIDLRTREVTPVGHPASMSLVGIDGLDLYRGDLIAVQNGLPGLSRVMRLRLSPDGLNVVALDVLDANLPDHDIPTTGVVVGDGYYYIANSQLRRFTAPGVVGPAGVLQKPVIRRINLTATTPAARAAPSR